MLNKLLILTTYFFLGLILFTYRITEVPPGINGDEAAIGYDAALVSRTGFDSSKRFLPIFSGNQGGSDYKQPITFYSEVLMFKLFGPSYFNLRAVSVIFVLVSGLLIFILINRLLGLMPAAASLLIFTTIPILMIQAHLALENIAPLPLITAWLFLLMEFLKRGKKWQVFLMSFTLGISMFSYLGMRLIIPVLILLNLSFKKIRRALLPFVAGLVPIIVLILIVKNQYPGAILGQYRPYNVTSYQDLVLPYISSYDPSFLFITGDPVPYHSTGKHGVFLLASLPLLILGIIRTIQKKDQFLIFTTVCFFLAPLLFGLGSPIHRGSRLLALLPFYTIISSFGFVTLLTLKSFFKKGLFIFLTIFLIVLNYQDFLSDYWYQYPQRVKSDFSKPIHKAFEKLNILSQNNNLTPFIQKDLYLQNPPAVDFFGEIYFPDKLQKWTLNQGLSKGSIVIIDPADVSLEMMGSGKSVKVENTNYAILIKEK